MASQPQYAVQYQTYYMPGKNGQPPIAVVKPQWVKISQGMRPQPTYLTGTPYRQLPHQTPVYISLPLPQAGYRQLQPLPGPVTYYRLNPAGEWAVFTSPWHNPIVGRRQWDPKKPMPVEDWLARANRASFN